MAEGYLQRRIISAEDNLLTRMERSEPIQYNEIYHVYNRGNRKQPIFGDTSDYLMFLKKLKSAAKKYSVTVHVYCLMPNHYHLILSQSEGGSIPLLMGAVATSAAKRFNLKYRTVGHLFQGPYRARQIDDESALLNVARYIHLNPVSARLVRKPEDWGYSDFRSFLFEDSPRPPGVEGFLHHSVHGAEENLLSIIGWTAEEYVRFVREYTIESIEKTRKYLFGEDGESFS